MSNKYRREFPDSAWTYEENRWETIASPRLNADFRIIDANRLVEPDACFQEARGLLRRLFGATDLDAMGGRHSVRVLSSMLSQYGSDEPSVPVIIKAIGKPVTVMFANDREKSIVRPRKFPRLIESGFPKLRLYHSGSRMILPCECLGLRNDPICYIRPDVVYKKLNTIELHERSDNAGRAKIYEGFQRSLCVNPDQYSAMCEGRPDPVIGQGPSLNVIRLSPRMGLGNYSSSRFGINFSACGCCVTDMWSKRSDFRQFLNVYPVEFRQAVGAILSIRRDL